MIMGSYGIGPARTMAAIVEQHHDEHGIKWPRSVAPYDVHLIALPGLEERAEEVARKLDEAGDDVLLDDRDQRAGEKFADADLIGLPVRVTVGKKTLEDGAVDVRERETGEERRVANRRTGKLALMARRRRFSDDPFGETLERLMTENGVTYRGLAVEDEALGRVPQSPRARQPARCRRTTSCARSRRRWTSSPSTSASTGCV